MLSSTFESKIFFYYQYYIFQHYVNAISIEKKKILKSDNVKIFCYYFDRSEIAITFPKLLKIIKNAIIYV